MKMPLMSLMIWISPCVDTIIQTKLASPRSRGGKICGGFFSSPYLSNYVERNTELEGQFEGGGSGWPMIGISVTSERLPNRSTCDALILQVAPIASL